MITRLPTKLFLHSLFIHLLILCLGNEVLWKYFGVPSPGKYLYLGLLLLLFSILFLLYILIQSRIFFNLLKIIFLILYSTVIMVAGIHADNVRSYGPIVADTIQAIYQTNIGEAFGYITSYVSITALAYCLSWILLVFVSLLAIRCAERSRKKIAALGALSGLTAAIGFYLIFIGRSSVIAIYQEAEAYSQALTQFNESRQNVESKVSQVNSDFSGTIIVVIGESLSRHHMGIYNYARNTTPYLNSISNELHVMDDIISTHSHTNPSLSDALSFNNRTQRLAPHSTVDLISLAKAAGFFTAWLSNQNSMGIWDNEVNAMARQADYIKYHDPATGTVRARSVFDKEIIPSLEEVLSNEASERKLIFLHMMAPHFPYCQSVPPAYASQTLLPDTVNINYSYLGQHLANMTQHNNQISINQYIESIECYDRAVVYADSVFKRIIDITRSEQSPSIVLFLSDHGENPLLPSGHDSRQHSHYHVEIPFILWANKAFHNQYPDKMERVQHSVHRPGSLVDFSYYLADLAGISENSISKTRSIFSKEYEPFSRTTLHGSIKYDSYDPNADYVETARANLGLLSQQYGSEGRKKVWAHRVNTIGSLLEAKEIFSGVEFDVVFDETVKQFFVYHPPANNTGLTLETQLLQDDGSLMYWLDWKNANRDNIDDALDKLSALDEQKSIKARSIIETSWYGPELKRISGDGWTLSYYLPTSEILDCMTNCNEKQKQILAQTINDRLFLGGFSAISFDAKMLPFFNNNLKKFVRSRHLKVFTWDTQINISSSNPVQQLTQLLEHDSIDVVLVNFPSMFDM